MGFNLLLHNINDLNGHHIIHGTTITTISDIPIGSNVKVHIKSTSMK